MSPSFGTQSFEIAQITGPTNTFDTSVFQLTVPAGFGDGDDTFALNTRADGTGGYGLFLDANGGDPQAAPEPMTATLFGLGGAALLGRRRRGGRAGGNSWQAAGRRLVRA